MNTPETYDKNKWVVDQSQFSRHANPKDCKLFRTYIDQYYTLLLAFTAAGWFQYQLFWNWTKPITKHNLNATNNHFLPQILQLQPLTNICPTERNCMFLHRPNLAPQLKANVGAFVRKNSRRTGQVLSCYKLLNLSKISALSMCFSLMMMIMNLYSANSMWNMYKCALQLACMRSNRKHWRRYRLPLYGSCMISISVYGI